LAVVGRVVEDSVPLAGINNGDLSSNPSMVVPVTMVIPTSPFFLTSGYFSADDGQNGFELWRISPVTGQVEMVEDSVPGGGIAPGINSSSPRYLTNIAGTLFFVANDGVNGSELWSVNGSGIATMVAGASAGGLSPGDGNSDPTDLTVVGSNLYFAATDGSNGRELWKVNSAGVASIVQSTGPGIGIRPGFPGSDPSYLTNVNGQLFFRANDGSNGSEVWRVNASGIAGMVEDNIPGGGIAPGFQDSYPSKLTNFNGSLYFAAYNDTEGTELWRVEPTGIASLVEDSVPGDGIAIGSGSSYPSYLTESGGTLYFQASNDTVGAELWRIGAGGIAQVVEAGVGGGINPGSASSAPSSLANVAGKLYFRAKNDSVGYELWRIASTGNAELVADIAPGTAGSNLKNLTAVQSRLYFSANDGTRGEELWTVQDSISPAMIVESSPNFGGIAPGTESSSPSQIISFNGNAFFVARSSAQGTELWQAVSPNQAAVVYRSVPGDGINPGAADSNPSNLSIVDDKLYFRANDGTHGVELWSITASPGLNVQATQVQLAANGAGINDSSASSLAKNLVLINGTLYFVASDGTNGTELWRLNNSGVAEIVGVTFGGGGIRAGAKNSNPRDLTNVNGVVYFSADTDTGTGFWRILPSGMAELVVDKLATSGQDAGPMTPRTSLLTNVNGILYFVAADSTNGNELWRVNASGAAELVEDAVSGGGLNPDSASSNPNLLINVNGTLYFTASNTATGEELWTVNGSGIAELVEDSVSGGGIYPSNYSSSPKELTNYNGTLYFQANDGTSGRELWRVPASRIAELVEDSIPLGGISPQFSSYPEFLRTLNGTLYFQANDGTTGVELWRVTSSGIAERVNVSSTGTDINPGLAGSNPREFVNVSGTIYFIANNLLNGYELWRINASRDAELVEDAVPGGGIRPGAGGSSPTNMTNVNGVLYFQANDGTNGFELWRVTSSGVAELVEDSIPGGGLTPGSVGSYPASITEVAGTAYFTATDSNRGQDLFTINSSGIAIPIPGEDNNNEILPGVDSSSPQYLTNFNSVLYFSANAGRRFGTELMRLALNNIPTLTQTNASVSGAVGSQFVNTGTWNDIDRDTVQLSASVGNILRNSNGTWNWSFTPTSRLTNQVVQITATDIFGESSSVTFTISAAVTVVNRQVFYNRATATSYGNGTGNPVNAIDPLKTALLPGGIAAISNYTNYRNGLNGLVIDVAGLGAGTTVADLRFATWNGISVSGFLATSAVPTVSLIPGGGLNGSTRIKIEFANEAIRNTWLRITLLANANTGLDLSDTFYFGNAVADMNVGNLGSPVTVSVDNIDYASLRRSFSNAVPASNIYDVNKDGRVDPIDLAIVNQNRTSRALRLFTAPVSLQLLSTSSPPVSLSGFLIPTTAIFSPSLMSSNFVASPPATAVLSNAMVPSPPARLLGNASQPPPLSAPRPSVGNNSSMLSPASLKITNFLGCASGTMAEAVDQYFALYR